MKCSNKGCGGELRIDSPTSGVCSVCGLIHNIQGDEVHKTATPKRNEETYERAFLVDGIIQYRK